MRFSHNLWVVKAKMATFGFSRYLQRGRLFVILAFTASFGLGLAYLCQVGRPKSALWADLVTNVGW